jgi:V/A-type H+-transporting ATPase subunit E
MGLEQVKKEILEHAEKEADAILKTANSEARELINEAIKKAEEYREKATQNAEKTMNSIEKMEIAATRLEIKKQLLDKKKDIIENIFAKAKEKISDMPQKDRDVYVTKLIEKAMKETDVKYVYANEKDSKAVKRFKGIEFIECDIMGGIIAENNDKTIRVDYSFEELLNGLKERSLQDLAQILF